MPVFCAIGAWACLSPRIEGLHAERPPVSSISETLWHGEGRAGVSSGDSRCAGVDSFGGLSPCSMQQDIAALEM